MKNIKTIIRSSKISDVVESLELVGIKFFTYMEVKGHGMEKRDDMAYRGVAYDAGYIPRTQIEMVVDDHRVEAVISAILKSASTGQVGDGKIIITPVEQFIRIRTGETGENAL